MDARNPLNIGAATPAMSNFGFHHLRVVNPYDVAFQGARSAVGAADLLARAEKYETVAKAVADCTLVVGTTAMAIAIRSIRFNAWRPARLSSARIFLRYPLRYPLRYLLRYTPSVSASGSGGCALLFGSEKFGLSNQDMSHCHWLMHIPTREEHFSMNLGQAVAVCLYELIRDPSVMPEPQEGSPASSAEVERITETCSQLYAPAIIRS